MRYALLFALICWQLPATELLIWQASDGLPQQLEGESVEASMQADGDRQVLQLRFPSGSPSRLRLPWTGWRINQASPVTERITYLLLHIRSGNGVPEEVAVLLSGPGADKQRQRFAALTNYAPLTGEWVEIRIPLKDMCSLAESPSIILGDPLLCLSLTHSGRGRVATDLLIDRIALISRE